LQLGPDGSKPTLIQIKAIARAAGRIEILQRRFGPNIFIAENNVCFWPLAGIREPPINVRFRGKADMAIALRNVHV